MTQLVENKPRRRALIATLSHFSPTRCRFVGRSFSSDITRVARSAYHCAASSAACTYSCDRPSESQISNRQNPESELYLTLAKSTPAPFLIANLSMVASLFRLLCDDVNIDSGGIAQKSIDRIHVENGSPSFDRRSSENYLRDVLLAHKLDDCFGDVIPLQSHRFRAQAFCELQISLQILLPLLRAVAVHVHMHRVKLRIHPARHSRRASDKILRLGARADAHRDALPHLPALLNILLYHVGFESAVHLLRYLAQREFTQRDQVSAAKEILQRLIHFLFAVHITALHAVLERLGREVHHHGFFGHLQHPVRNRFAHHHAGDGANRGSNALDVLDVYGRDHVDSSFEEFENILVSLAPPAAGNVRMRKLVHKDHPRTSRQNCIDVHFLEDRAFVVDLPAGYRFELRGQFRDAFSSVRFDHSDYHVFAAAMPPNRFAQHAVRFPDAGRVAEEELQSAFRFFAGLRILQPLFGGFRHGRLFYFPGAWKATVEWRRARDFFQSPHSIRGRLRHRHCDRLFLPPGSARQRHYRGSHASARYLSRFYHLGHGRVGFHVRDRHARVQLLLSSSDRNFQGRGSAELGGAVRFSNRLGACQPAFESCAAASAKRVFAPQGNRKIIRVQPKLARIGQRDSVAEPHSGQDRGHLRSRRGGLAASRQTKSVSFRPRDSSTRSRKPQDDCRARGAGLGRCRQPLFRSGAHGRAFDRQPGNFRHDSVAANARSVGNADRGSDGARPRRRATWPDRSGAGRRASAHRAARRGHARSPHSAYLALSVRHQPACQPGPERCAKTRAFHHHQ